MPETLTSWLCVSPASRRALRSRSPNVSLSANLTTCAFILLVEMLMEFGTDGTRTLDDLARHFLQATRHEDGLAKLRIEWKSRAISPDGLVILGPDGVQTDGADAPRSREKTRFRFEHRVVARVP